MKLPVFNLRKSVLIFLMGSGLSVSTMAKANDLQVVELFTSQGCYSCPAADKLISRIASRFSNILNLEFHVDYWNDLNYKNQGNWQDPFSSAEFTKRQRQYSALGLKGENGVYTPQAVVNGEYGLVGSNRRALKKVLSDPQPMPVKVAIDRTDEASLTVQLKGSIDIASTVYLVTFLKATETAITSGENHDKIMRNHNVVTEVQAIGSFSGGNGDALQVAYSDQENQGCAVLVQPTKFGQILGAARCP